MENLNSTIGNNPMPAVIQRLNEEYINDNREILITLYAQNDLRINNTVYEHKGQHKYTFGITRNKNSVIDYIITNREIQPSPSMV